MTAFHIVLDALTILLMAYLAWSAWSQHTMLREADALLQEMADDALGYERDMLVVHERLEMLERRVQGRYIEALRSKIEGDTPSAESDKCGSAR
jgi:hypothetical protein